MSEQFSTQFKTEGQPAFPVANDGEGTPSASSTDEPSATTGTDDDGTDGKQKEDAGFADHPRWKEREYNWKTRFNEQEKRHQDELEALRNGSNQQKATPAAPAAADEDVEVPNWFNGDAQEYKEFLSWNQEQHRRILAAEREQQEKTQREEKERIETANKWFEGQVSAIEADKDLNPDGEKVDVNKLLKFTMENELVDTQGRWNYKAGYRMMRAQSAKGNQEGIAERKKIASATTDRGRSEPKPSQFTTSADFRDPTKRPW